MAIWDNQNNVVFGPTAANIVEQPAGSGAYSAESLVAPAAIGQYAIVWSDDGSFTEGHTEIDDLTVVAAGSGSALPPLTPVGPGPGAQPGPCNSWTTGDEVADCCNATVGTDTSVFDSAIDAATRTLWTLSGRQFSGTCDATVRPCNGSSTFFQVLSRGHIVDLGGVFWNGFRWWEPTGLSKCSCHRVCEVQLWYPVREVVEVKIDGIVVDVDDYFVYDRRTLVRKNGLCWPCCQRMDMDDTEHGTFSVRFTWGVNPPDSGQAAAKELACEIFKACSDDAEGCRLPSGVTRITRTGVTIERSFFRRDPVTKAWATGLPLVDAFLNESNPGGLRRRPAVYSPDLRYPRPSPV